MLTTLVLQVQAMPGLGLNQNTAMDIWSTEQWHCVMHVRFKSLLEMAIASSSDGEFYI